MVVTVSAELPVIPSLVAVMVADPIARPVTSPLTDTAATPRALDAQVTVRPESTFPFASLIMALSCCVEPTHQLAAAGLIVTEATGRGAPAAVVPLATVDSPPNTASTYRVPRNAT